jgi:2-amino-4-hydroxy-6-hydroxymethyldihydropteridine diphosphokinase
VRKKLLDKRQTGGAILALGANISGAWGTPLATLRRLFAELRSAGITIQAVSALYETAPVGLGRQPRILNAVVLASAALPPARLLAVLKRLERQAGRTSRRRSAARTLDIDIIDFGGRVIGWPPARRRAPLALPHPEAHRRAFVLLPLLDVRPAWWHPALKVPAVQLLRCVPRRPGDVCRKLDSRWISCEEDV